MVVPSLEPNRIHMLPVRIQYHLPFSSHTFTTTLPTPQQVYVYPAAPSGDANAEIWGSIYLKTVVQGVVMASPEVYPTAAAGPSTATTTAMPSPDLSLYIYDPRETYLRKSRPAHLRPSSSRPSSPAAAASSPNPDPSGVQEQAVWTGKGLVSWALNELGVGKNLITGRLVRSAEYSNTSPGQSAHAYRNPLEALMMQTQGQGQGEEEAWGIEVSLGLKQATSFGLPSPSAPVHAPAPARPAAPAPVPAQIGSSTSSSTYAFQHPSHPAVPRRPAMPNSVTIASVAAAHAPAPPAPRRAPHSTPAPARKPDAPSTSTSTRAKAAPASRKKRPVPPPSRHLTNVDTNAKTSNTASAENLPFEIPRHVYDNPELLTKEQAERLIASPLFLDRISQMTGHPLVPRMKRERDDDQSNGGLGSAKKPRFNRTDADGQSTSMCYNCGRVKSYVWRQLTLDDGNVVTICNACGLYKNRHGHMRPPSMWEGVDDEVKTLRLGGQTQTQTQTAATAANTASSEIDMPATRLDSAFKRTMSAVVNKDAKRIASLRKPTPTANANVTRSVPPMPMTSPPRGSASAAKTVRRASHVTSMPPPIAASSPAVKTAAKIEPIEFDPNESPNTAIRRILGTNMPLQSLEMPLSDDGSGGAGTAGGGGSGKEAVTVDWASTDISSYFNVDSFEMSAGPRGAHSLRSPSPPPPSAPPFTRSVSSRRAYTHGGPSGGSAGDEDDVLSQLFNRTSSIGPLEASSPASASVPFDFSQLPPSSPPASCSDLGHSALLLSSPQTNSSASPNMPLPLPPHSHAGTRISPDRKSSLKHSFTPEEYAWAHDASSGEVAEHMLGHPHDQIHGQGQPPIDADDFMAFFNSLSNPT